MSRNRQPVLLLVEDDQEIRDLLATVLEEAGFRVQRAHEGEHALRTLHAYPRPDLILTDLMMPGMDGFAFLRAYQNLGGPHVPVVAMSAMPAYVHAARGLPFAAVLEKPLELPRLLGTLRLLLEDPTRRLDLPVVAGANEQEERSRQQTIADLHLDQPATEPSLRQVLEQIARYFGVSTALVTVITIDRQFWTEGCGLPKAHEAVRGTPRRDSFCTHSVEAVSPLVVTDAAESPVFSDSLAVREGWLRFYAGVPLISRHGDAIGTLCLIDPTPRPFDGFDLELLQVFSRRVLGELEWREKREHPEVPDAAFSYLNQLDTQLGIFGREAFMDVAAADGLRCLRGGRQVACVCLAVSSRRLKQTVSALHHTVPSVVGRLGHSRIGWLVPSFAPEEAQRLALDRAGPTAKAESMKLMALPSDTRAGLYRMERNLGDAGLA